MSTLKGEQMHLEQFYLAYKAGAQGKKYIYMDVVVTGTRTYNTELFGKQKTWSQLAHSLINSSGEQIFCTLFCTFTYIRLELLVSTYASSKETVFHVKHTNLITVICACMKPKTGDSI